MGYGSIFAPRNVFTSWTSLRTLKLDFAEKIIDADEIESETDVYWNLFPGKMRSVSQFGVR